MTKKEAYDAVMAHIPVPVYRAVKAEERSANDRTRRYKITGIRGRSVPEQCDWFERECESVLCEWDLDKEAADENQIVVLIPPEDVPAFTRKFNGFELECGDRLTIQECDWYMPLADIFERLRQRLLSDEEMVTDRVLRYRSTEGENNDGGKGTRQIDFQRSTSVPPCGP